MWRVAAASGLAGVISYADYFPQYRSPFHLTCESLVLGFAIAWMSRQSWSSRISRPIREALFWGGAAGVLYWLVPSVILARIDARTIVLAPALIGLCFGAMVLAAVSGSGSYSVVIGRSDVATAGDRLIHAVSHAHDGAARGRLLSLRAPVPLGDGASLAARWLAFLPWYLALTVLVRVSPASLRRAPALQSRVIAVCRPLARGLSDRRARERGGPVRHKTLSTAFFHPA